LKPEPKCYGHPTSEQYQRFPKDGMDVEKCRPNQDGLLGMRSSVEEVAPKQIETNKAKFNAESRTVMRVRFVAKEVA